MGSGGWVQPRSLRPPDIGGMLARHVDEPARKSPTLASGHASGEPSFRLLGSCDTDSWLAKRKPKRSSPALKSGFHQPYRTQSRRKLGSPDACPLARVGDFL